MASIIEAAAQRLSNAQREDPPAGAPRPPVAPDFTATLPRRFAAPPPELTGDARRPVLLRLERESTPPASPTPAPAPGPAPALQAAPPGSACGVACGAGNRPVARHDGATLWRVAAMAAAVGAGLMYSAMALLGPATTQRDPAKVASVASVENGATGAGVPAVSTSVSAVATPAPAVMPAPAAVPAAAAADTHEDARRFVMAWAQAWSAADVDAYLAHYAPGFTPGNGLSSAQWQAQRRKRIAAARGLDVKVSDLAFEPAGDGRLTARFTQDYSTESYREPGTAKTLTLLKGAGGWRIVAEVAGQGSDSRPTVR